MNQLIRLVSIYLRARWRSRCGLLHPYSVEFTVQLTDLDIFLHMNNGRYFSIMDLGRVDLFVRSGLLEAIRKQGFGVTVAAETLRFRRSLTLFQRFTLETRILGWDEKAIIIQQRFLRRAERDLWEVAAQGVVRARLVSKGKAQPSTGFLRAFGPEFEASPPLPPWVAEWRQKQEAGPPA